MVQYIPSNRTKQPSFAQSVVGGIVQGIPQAVNAYKTGKQQVEENQAIKEIYGIDLTGVTEPETRQSLITHSLKGKQDYKKAIDVEQLKGNIQRESFGEKFGQQYKAKYEAQKQMMHDLGLDKPYDYGNNPQQGQQPQNQQQQPKDRDQEMADHLLGFDEEPSPRKPQQQQQENKTYRPLIPQQKIDAMGQINPQEASRMQRYNEDIRNEKRHDEDISLRKKTAQSKEVSESYKENEPFISKIHDQFEDSLRKEAILDRSDQLDESGELSDSGMINFLRGIGLKDEWLKNPANEEYTKLSLDLLGGGSLQADYGSRVLQSEFKVSMQRIPELSQTQAGRRQIKENIRAMMLPSKLKNERLQFYLDKSERTGEPLPHDLRGKVLKDIKPQLEESYDKFKQRNGRYSVRKDTRPDDNAIEKYYYLSNQNEDKAIEMMREDGYNVK